MARVDWQDVFSADGHQWLNANELSEPVALSSLTELKAFLDAAHIRLCLAKPFQENKNYPLVESRELLPSFDSDMYEHKSLPGFSLVAFARPLDCFSEIFQYDSLHSVTVSKDGTSCPLENQVVEQNLLTLSGRLSRNLQTEFRERFKSFDTSLLDHYPALLPYLLNMDRAQVMAWDSDKLFHLAGVFASFPSDIDSELKRFGMRIGKFAFGDSGMYERNRMFVYQFLMELYGFPIVSERRTSAALFARKLHKMGERFLLRVLGQTDRVLTTYISDGEESRYPRVEKTALVALDEDQREAIETIGSQGYFLDSERRVVIMRIIYRQHRYNANNVRQDRALSVARQEVLHPLSGKPLPGLNIVKDAGNMFLRLNDIVRGEFQGRIVYKRTEIVENTDTDEKKLKFLYSWLLKHQRRMIGYSDEFFSRVEKVLTGYLRAPEKTETFDSLRELYQEVQARLGYIQQARKVRVLEDLTVRQFRGSRVPYRKMMAEAARFTAGLQYEIVNFFPDLVETILLCLDHIIRDRYLQRTYIEPPQRDLTAAGLEIRKNYGRLVSLRDAIASVRKARMGTAEAEASVA